MKRFNRLALAAVTAFGGVVAVSGAQAATASASISDVYVQLFDINPFDGITAAITFADGASFVGAYSATTTTTAWINSNTDYQAAASPVSLSKTYTLGGSSASGSTLAGSLLSAASGNGATATASNTVQGLTYGSYGTLFSAGFTLTGNTVMVVTANATAAVSAAAGESAWANGTVQIALPNNTGYSYGQAYRQIEANGNSSGTGSPISVQASFVNLGAGSVSGRFDAWAGASAAGVAAPVPEPETYALFTAGLLVLGFLVRRRGG